jgi:alkanesulfonate monooxygenase SsuD/methylene tetrahydromethanopterin reductase-like flavin-dependent oxidoreductase (luciferase family)
VAEHQHQVGFAIQVFPNDTPVDPSGYLLAAGRLADALGFDAFFTADHPAWNLDPWVHLAAVAVTTRRVRLGICVVGIHYRHPVLTARLAADLDNLSDGRLILGLGNGWDANEYANFGQPFPSHAERASDLTDAIEIVRGVWGPEPFSYQGRQFATSNSRITPPPVQQPGPPLLIAGGGERVTLRQVARFADACNLPAFGEGLIGAAPTPQVVRHKLDVLRAHCDAIGRPYESVLRTYHLGWVILATDEGQLRAKLNRYFPEGLARRYSGAFHNFVLPATPTQLVERCCALVAQGIQYFIAETLDAADHETIRLLGEQVIPRLAPS